MKIKTSPDDAQITIKGIQNGETIVLPSASMVLLNKNSDYVITAASQGYKSQSVTINRGFHGGMYIDAYWETIGVAGGVIEYLFVMTLSGGNSPGMALFLGATSVLILSIPLIIDINTNNIWYHTPDKVNLELSAEGK